MARKSISGAGFEAIPPSENSELTTLSVRVRHAIIPC